MSEEGGTMSTRPGTYTVKAGDTLTGIATRFGMAPVELVRINHLRDANSLRVGEVLSLSPEAQPAGGGGATASSPPTAAPQPPTAPPPVAKAQVTASDIVAKFAPRADAAYVEAFKDKGGLLAAAGITTPLRLAHFMAQCFTETGGLKKLVESGVYSEEGLGSMWDKGNWHRYFNDRSACVAMAGKCKGDKGVALFNLVYSNRMGNGGPETGDGWTYRGRGLLQTTGREGYRALGAEYEADPDLATRPDTALKPAISKWRSGNLNAAADRNDIETITRVINGGLNGLEDRKAWFAKIYPFAKAGG